MSDIDKIAGAAPVAAPAKPKADPKMEATAKDFESVFLGQMMKTMMESVEQDGQFTGGQGEEMFRGVLAEKLGTEMAKRGGLGLAPAVLDQMIKVQEGNR